MKKKKFMFVTSDGFTQDMENNDTENCQVLGCSEGLDLTDALNRLKKENAWINDYKYENIYAYKLLDVKELHI